MKSKRYFFAVALALMLPFSAGAELYHSGGKTWSSIMDGRGLYGRGLPNSPHTISLVLSPIYYSGDVELPGNWITGNKDHATTDLYTAIPGANSKANSISFSGALQYTYRANKHLAYRAQFMGGYMRGHTEFTRPHEKSNGYQSTSYFLRDFHSVFFEYGVGLEIYPSAEAGFFFYAGISGTSSIITRQLQSLSMPGHTASPNKSDYHLDYELPASEQKIFSTVPMIPVGIGYKWNIKAFQIGIELIWHPALVDLHHMNLDGWVSGNIDQAGISHYPVEGKTNRWTDSFTELGISFGYTIPTLYTP